MSSYSRQRATRLIPALQLSLRSALAAGLAVVIAERLRLEYPLYSMIGAVIVTELSPAETRRLGASRLLGTLIGATMGAALSHVVSIRPLSIAVGIALTMALTHAIGLPSTARLAGYLSGIVLLSYHDHPWLYAWSRTVETVIGIATAVLVSVLPKICPAVQQPEIRDQRG